MAPVFLITGATGRQGGSAARILLERGMAVHVLVRKRDSAAAQQLESLGAVVFEGDFNHVAAIQEASKGVSGIFLNLWPTQDPADQARQAQAFIDIAKANDAAIVASTAFLATRSDLWGDVDGLKQYYAGKVGVENALREAKLASYTILRPALLMHNYLMPDSKYHFPELSTEGVVAHAYAPGRRMAHLEAADVGKFAAEALLQPAKFNGHEIELGFDNLTQEEIGEALSEVSGRTVKVHRWTEDEIKEKQGRIVTLPWQLLANEHDLSVDGEKLQSEYGITLTSFSEFLHRDKAKVMESLPSA
ncbi:unnamed protein product [Clonostachys chloroleuca]|uniref:NmrA-like domain-containing protein n=1 Tax=Clonostachys chloroleuca TaxID=1926264 RepID=A0AA35MHT1_9HYPO|nr:unnamed protein product [Clonostachys chloroleuca]